MAFFFYRFFLPLLSLALAFTAHLAPAQHSILQDGREVIQLENEPAGVVWVVQLSDLHISSYHPDRAQSLQRFLGPVLALINPALVLITGDLTDAKTKDRATRRQDEAEWVQYVDSINKVIKDSGLPQHAFYDIRGNHDKFGVPEVGSRLDYFSKYSVSAQKNRTSTVQSVTLMNSGWKHLFVGIDDSMGIGLRGPCNLFGHPTDEQLQKLDLELSQWDTCQPEQITKIVFGHYPMSFTASTETRKRPESIFAKHSISAYICGHLHASFGTNLFKHYLHLPSEQRAFNSAKGCESGLRDSEHGEFWEWEMGDWRMCRIIRVIAIDKGHTSFVDLNFFDLNASYHDALKQLPTVVLPTYPLDSQKMQRLTPLPLSSSYRDSVRALVFSPQPLVSVAAKIFDSNKKHLGLLEDLEMHTLSNASDRGLLYVAQWNSTKYLDPCPTRYLLQIVVVDSLGKQTYSKMRPFSVNNKIGQLEQTWREFFVMGFVWDEIYPILLWAAFSILFGFFILPKFYFLYLVKSGYYNRWVFSIFRGNSKKLTIRKALEIIIWFFVQGCGNGTLWWGQLLLLTYLILFPWFWGQVLAEGYPAGYMSIHGWTVQIAGTQHSQWGLGWPDLMVIVLPYLYWVLLPLFILVFALSAEKSLHELYALDVPASRKKKEHDEGGKMNLVLSNSSTAPGDEGQQNLSRQGISSRPELESVDTVLQKEHKGTRWIRMVLIIGCLAVAFVHFGQVFVIVSAYGVKALLASPGFAWPVPLLLTAAVLQTTALRKHK